MECGRGLGVGLSKKAGCVLFVLDIDGSVKVAQWRTQDFNIGGAKEVARIARENFKVPHPLFSHAHEFELYYNTVSQTQWAERCDC